MSGSITRRQALTGAVAFAMASRGCVLAPSGGALRPPRPAPFHPAAIAFPTVRAFPQFADLADRTW
jgi:hypothetical protein